MVFPSRGLHAGDLHTVRLWWRILWYRSWSRTWKGLPFEYLSFLETLKKRRGKRMKAVELSKRIVPKLKKKWLIFQLKWFIWKCLFREDWCFFLAQRCRTQKPKALTFLSEGWYVGCHGLAPNLGEEDWSSWEVGQCGGQKTKERRKQSHLFGSSSMFAVTDCN